MIQPRIQSIILHLDNLEALKCLTAASMGNVIFALMNYAACGEMPQFKNRALMAVFHLLRAALDRDMAKYQTRCGSSATKNVAARTARTTGSNVDDGTANAVSPHTPLNNNNNNNNYNNNNNNNNHHSHHDDSAREEVKMEGDSEREETEASAISETATAASAEATAERAAIAETLNAETQNAETLNAAAEDLSFQWVYNLYDKPAGDGFFAQSVWNTLKDDERRAAIEYIKAYVKMRPNRQFRKNFCNFLQQRTWETEPLTDYRRPAAPAAAACQDKPNDYPSHGNHYRRGRRDDGREENIDYFRKLLAAEGYDYDSLFANY
ncbi:MAG: DUF6291 domain-containing protein [Alloprevotella sp.]